MIVSALLTSVGINLALCILFFIFFSILRKQPGNLAVYAPRSVAEGKLKRRAGFYLDRVIPNPDWVRNALEPSEEELLLSSGLDAVVFMRTIIFSLRVFAIAGFIGVFILLPVNCSGDQLENINFANFSSNSLDVFSISNVNNGSKRLWVHFSAIYVLTFCVCCLLYFEYKNVSSKRIAYFNSSKPQPNQFSILVRNIPVAVGSSVSNSVESFFTEYHPSTYLSHVVVHRTNKVQGLIDEGKKLYKRLLRLQTESTKPKFERHGCFGLFGDKVNLLDECERKLEDLEENVRLEQSDASMEGEEVRAAFVSFKSRYGAAVALNMQQSINPTQWLTERAPEPHDVYWPFFSSSFMQRWISKLAIVLAAINLTILFLFPVLFVQGLANLSQLEVWLPFLTPILAKKFVSQIITGYLPNLILQLFLKVAPPIMKLLSSMQGYIAYSEIVKSACIKVIWFMVWNIFFANTLSGSVFTQIDVFLEPKNFPSKLAVAVPAQASFFIAYVVTLGWTSTSSELFQIIPFIWSLVKKPFVKRTDDEEFEVPDFPYHVHLPKIIFFGLLGMTYFFLAPLILPFLLVYFCLAYLIYRNQFIKVYAPVYETGGKFWPIVHDSTIFSLVLMHAIAVGIFTLKKLPIASTLIFPLPILTLLFNEYCRKRFHPIFVAFSAESLIKKDREDCNDGTMDEFYEKLACAYQDPALSPFKYSANPNGSTSPLLSSTAEILRDRVANPGIGQSRG